MALYKADVWLGSNSGRQTVSVSASTPTGAKEQIRTIYHVRDTAIWNVREVPRERAGSGDIGDGSDASLWGGAALVALLAVVWGWPASRRRCSAWWAAAPPGGCCVACRVSASMTCSCLAAVVPC